jgi:hypothetical protein
MKRIVTFMALVALCNVSRGDIIDLLANPGALPSNKPSTVQAQLASTCDGWGIAEDITLSAIEYDTDLNLVTYYQLYPITLTWASGDQFTVHDLSSKLDPTGSFAGSFTDFGAPSTFTTVLTFPTFSPTLFGPVSFSGSVSGSATDGTTGPNGVSYTPAGGNPGVFRYELYDTTAALITNFFLDPGASFAAGPPNSHTTGPYDNSGSPIIVGAGPNGVGSVQVVESLVGSGGTDQYAFTGRWDANPVPEPSTLILAFLGIAGLGALARKRRV